LIKLPTALQAELISLILLYKNALGERVRIFNCSAPEYIASATASIAAFRQLNEPAGDNNMASESTVVLYVGFMVTIVFSGDTGFQQCQNILQPPGGIYFYMEAEILHYMKNVIQNYWANILIKDKFVLI
jgi:hypothetical protein